VFVGLFSICRNYDCSGRRENPCHGWTAYGPCTYASSKREPWSYPVSILLQNNFKLGILTSYRYSAEDLDTDIDLAADVNDTANALLPNRDDTGIVINGFIFNLRDQIRENGTVPLQFQYLPADCRLYYTVANIYNMSTLWRDVANANWIDRSSCLQGSETNSTTQTEPPVPSNLTVLPPVVNWPTNETVPDLGYYGDGGIQDRTPSSKTIQPCGASGCAAKACDQVLVTCDGKSLGLKPVCIPDCSKRSGSSTNCGNGLSCQQYSGTQNKLYRIGNDSPPVNQAYGLSSGFTGKCLPSNPSGYPAPPGMFGCKR
jgi:hypothetical protein